MYVIWSKFSFKLFFASFHHHFFKSDHCWRVHLSDLRHPLTDAPAVPEQRVKVSIFKYRIFNQTYSSSPSRAYILQMLNSLGKHFLNSGLSSSILFLNRTL